MAQRNPDDLVDLAMVCLVIALLVVWILGISRMTGH